MKLYIYFLLMILSFSAIGQNGKYDILEVVEVDNTSKEELYNRAIQWFSTAYKSANDVIQLADKEQGVIIGKGAVVTYIKVLGSQHDAGLVYYTITISAKDNKYKYEINSVYHDKEYSELAGSGGSLNNEIPSCGNFKISKKYWESIKSYADSGLNYLVKSLKTSMALPSKTTDW